MLPTGCMAVLPACGDATFLLRDGEERTLPGKTTIDLQPGDILRIETPGGGGFGAPSATGQKRSVT